MSHKGSMQFSLGLLSYGNDLFWVPLSSFELNRDSGQHQQNSAANHAIPCCSCQLFRTGKIFYPIRQDPPAGGELLHEWNADP